MLISLSSISGAPGVSSWGLALAVAWPSPGPPRVLLEADPSGGVLAARFGMTIDPGVASLISQVRLVPDGQLDVAGHGRRLTGSAWCLPGPISIQAAEPVWRAAAAVIAPRLAADGRLWLADCGRVHPAGTTRPLLDRSMAHLLFCDGSDTSLMAVPPQLEWLSKLARVGLVVIGPRRRSPSELTDFLGCDAVWSLRGRPDLNDLVAAATRSPWVRRSPRWRSIERAVAAIAEWLVIPPDPPAVSAANAAVAVSATSAAGPVAMVGR